VMASIRKETWSGPKDPTSNWRPLGIPFQFHHSQGIHIAIAIHSGIVTDDCSHRNNQRAQDLWGKLPLLSD
jgi:hypothetical protein